MNYTLLEEKLSELPLFSYFYISPDELEFSDRVRWICEHECKMYGQSWACPPGVGTVTQCKSTCLKFAKCLAIATVTEVDDISNIQETLLTRSAHEDVTNHADRIVKSLGCNTLVLSTEACAICEHCAYIDNEPCRFPDRMHPCVESQGINIIPVLEKNGIEFQYGSNVVTWVSLIFFNE